MPIQSSVSFSKSTFHEEEEKILGSCSERFIPGHCYHTVSCLAIIVLPGPLDEMLFQFNIFCTNFWEQLELVSCIPQFINLIGAFSAMVLDFTGIIFIRFSINQRECLMAISFSFYFVQLSTEHYLV